MKEYRVLICRSGVAIDQTYFTSQFKKAIVMKVALAHAMSRMGNRKWDSIIVMNGDTKVGEADKLKE